jgi:hypothetical protein
MANMEMIERSSHRYDWLNSEGFAEIVNRREGRANFVNLVGRSMFVEFVYRDIIGDSALPA